MRELLLAEKLVRLRGPVTQKQAAERAGIPPATLCKLERSQRGTSTRRESVSQRQGTLAKLADAFNVTVEYLTTDLPTYMRLFASNRLAEPDMTPGQRLLLVLEEVKTRFGIEEAEIAKALSIFTVDLDGYKQDNLLFSPDVFDRLEELIGVPAEWILHGVAPESSSEPAIIYRRSLALALVTGIPPSELDRLIIDWSEKRKEPLPE